MSDEYLKLLAEQRQKTWDAAKALLDTAAGEKRELTAEETQSYERMTTELNEKREQIDALVEQRRQQTEAEETVRGLGLENLGNRDEQRKVDLAEQFRSLAEGTGKAVQISARELTEGLRENRALGTVSATAGGNTVPRSFRNVLLQHLVESSGLLRLGPTVLSTDGGEPFDVPITTSHGAAAAVAEAGTIGGTDPAFGKRTLSAYKYGQLVLVPSELLSDTGVDLTGYIAETAGRNLGLAYGADLITGNGTSKPTGAATTATAGKTGSAAVAGAFSADDLIDLMFSVIAPYRASSSAGWLVKDSTLGAIRKLKDGAGRYLFEPARTFGEPDMVLGKPIETDPNVAAVATGAKSVLFGDWSRYFVRMAGGVRFDRSVDFKFDSDQVAFRALVRVDGITADQTGAIKTFVGGAA